MPSAEVKQCQSNSNLDVMKVCDVKGKNLKLVAHVPKVCFGIVDDRVMARVSAETCMALHAGGLVVLSERFNWNPPNMQGGSLKLGEIGNVAACDAKLDRYSWGQCKVGYKEKNYLWYHAPQLLAAEEKISAAEKAKWVTSLKPLDRVTLAEAYSKSSDASKGPLEPGFIGTVVRCNERCYVTYGPHGAWWYDVSALQKTNDVIVFKVGDRVTVADDYKKIGKSGKGPLKPGFIGTVVTCNDQYQVRYNDLRWWYDVPA